MRIVIVAVKSYRCRRVEGEEIKAKKSAYTASTHDDDDDDDSQHINELCVQILMLQHNTVNSVGYLSQ